MTGERETKGIAGAGNSSSRKGVNRMETMLSKENQPEVEEMVKFLKELSDEEKREMHSFIQGIKFAKKMNASKETA